MNYWIIVASKDHVEIGKKSGFCQACHGKKQPLKKMSPNDKVLFYSSKEKFGESKPYQKFTAVGIIVKGQVYQSDMENDFQPFRRDIKFLECREAEIHPLLEELHFIDDAGNWGYKLKNGFLQIDEHDYVLISGKMF